MASCPAAPDRSCEGGEHGIAFSAAGEAWLSTSHVHLLGAVRLMSVPFVGCMALAAVLNRLPPEILPAIQAVEGGTVGTVANNANGTDDLGVMQLNTSWLPALARLTAVPVAELRVRLVNNACLNITVAGVILRSYLAETGGDLWDWD